MTAPRLRFAPSPTGYLHIGGVRTALFNWLWARRTGGRFILRIEDTDRERSTPENEQVILRDLRWLGLDWDEGPDVGGEHGPYRQTERLQLYAEQADKLIAAGAAYRCYCTKEELDEQRRRLREEDPKAQFRYPGTCRDRSDQPDKPSVLRLRAPSAGSVTYRDLVFGEVTTPCSTFQDVVLQRQDGVPLYNFGCVVDDLTMGITLVARGRDHMINTPLQILLFRALGYEPPEFAHLPMMLGKKGVKLSKRHGAVAVSEYREQGVVPAALLNYLVRFGWSYGDQEIFSLAELQEKFGWDRCGRADGRFDPTKLTAISFEHLKRPELTSDEAYAAGVRPFIEAKGRKVDPALLQRCIAVVRERASTLVDAAGRLDFIFSGEDLAFDEKAKQKFLLSDKARVLAPLRAALAAVDDFSAETLEQAVRGWAESEGLKLGAVAQPARVALTGSSASPGLFEVMELLGKDLTLARLDQALALTPPSRA